MDTETETELFRLTMKIKKKFEKLGNTKNANYTWEYTCGIEPISYSTGNVLKINISKIKHDDYVNKKLLFELTSKGNIITNEGNYDAKLLDTLKEVSTELVKLGHFNE